MLHLTQIQEFKRIDDCFAGGEYKKIRIPDRLTQSSRLAFPSGNRSIPATAPPERDCAQSDGGSRNHEQRRVAFELRFSQCEIHGRE